MIRLFPSRRRRRRRRHRLFDITSAAVPAMARDHVRIFVHVMRDKSGAYRRCVMAGAPHFMFGIIFAILCYV